MRVGKTNRILETALDGFRRTEGDYRRACGTVSLNRYFHRGMDFPDSARAREAANSAREWRILLYFCGAFVPPQFAPPLQQQAFTGDRCKLDRQSRESILVESPCLSALWLTQPDKLDSLLGERSLSDGGGLIPRFLCCHTPCEAREIVKDAPEIPASVANDYANLIRNLIETYRLAEKPFTIEPTPEALDAMNVHHNGIMKRRRIDLRDVTIYAARWNEQAWRIAVCLHAGLHGAHAHEQRLETRHRKTGN